MGNKLKILIFSLFGIITGDLLDKCRLPNPSPYGVGIGFPRVQNRANSIGNLNVTILFVDFSDAPAKETTQYYFSIISPTAESFFFKNSYGKLQVKFSPLFKWLRMSKPSTEYNMSPSISYYDQKAYLSEASSLASDWDFSTSQLIVVITNPYANAVPYGPTFNANKGDGFIVKGKVFENAINSGRDFLHWKNFWLPHEMGHSMGLPDLYSYGDGYLFKFTGGWSIMSHINGEAREFFGWERWLLGWLDDSQVVCATSLYTKKTLTAIEIPNGLKIIVVPISSYRAVVIESRKKFGFDSEINKPGLLVYLVDSSIKSGNGALEVLPLNHNDNRKMNATLSVGTELNFENVKIYYEKSSSTTDDVVVLRI